MSIFKKLTLALLVVFTLFACSKEEINPTSSTETPTAQNDETLCFPPRNFFRGVNANGSHFYSFDTEFSRALQNGYTYEGIMCKIWDVQARYEMKPLYRYYASSTDNHFYTTNFNELRNGNASMRYEGVVGWVYPYSGIGCYPTIAIHRYYHPGAGKHFYTNNFNELGNGAHGYRYEGVAFYAVKF